MNFGDPITDRDVRIPMPHAALAGRLDVPLRARGVVLFAHGSGSSRSSPRNVFVPRQLQRAGIATLLFNLLMQAEEQRDMLTREHRFDIELLSRRLTDVRHWVHSRDELRELPIGSASISFQPAMTGRMNVSVSRVPMLSWLAHFRNCLHNTFGTRATTTNSGTCHQRAKRRTNTSHVTSAARNTYGS